MWTFIFPPASVILDDAISYKGITHDAISAHGWIALISVFVSVFVSFMTIGCATQRRTPLSLSPKPEPADFIKTIAKIKESIAPVVCVHPNPNVPNEWILDSVEGTAFFLRIDGTFVTAGHVVRDFTIPTRARPCQRSAIYLPNEGWQSRVTDFRVRYFFFIQTDCTRDEAIDIAICRSPNNIRQELGRDPVPVVLNTVLQEDGVPAAFSGFPLNLVLPLTSQGSVAAYRGTTDDQGPRELVIDKGNWGGASGSPIYLEDGAVIGILLERGIGESAGITIGRPASFIERMLSTRH
ncbi:MAG: serine protease [Bryobacteraceae bacterium]